MDINSISSLELFFHNIDANLMLIIYLLFLGSKELYEMLRM